MKNLNQLLLLSALTASVLAGCRPVDGPGFGFALPGELRLAELDADARARLTATLEIDGVLDERPLQIAPDLSEVTGVFELDGVEEPRSSTFTLRLWLDGEDETEDDVLLARALGTADIQPQTNTELVPEGGDNPFDTCGAPAPPCEVALDLNRNDRPNLDDLVDGIDPLPPPPFTDIAPSTLQFPSGIRLGSFARQVIVLENTTAGVIEASARIINAPGATLSRYDTQEGGTVQDRGLRAIDLGEISPFEERFLAVSFAPVNAFLTTGDVYLESRDPVSGVRQATRVKIIANADGELQPTRDGFDPAPLAASAAALGGFEGEVQLYPAEELWNGLPITGVSTSETVSTGLPYTGRTLRAVFDEDGSESVIPADAAFLVEVEPEHQLSLSLGGLNTDVDLAALWLDDDDAITADAANNLRSARAGLSPEAIEVRNDTDQKRRALVVLGRVEANAPAATPGALSAEEEAQMSLSGQESNPPQITAIDPVIGPLEGGNRVLITGLGFQQGAQVTFANAVALDCSWAKDDVTDVTTMDCTAPPGSLEVGKNPATVVVENPSQDEGGDGQAASLLEGYTYLPPAPQLDSLSPRVAPTGGSAGTISLIGRFFSTRYGPPRVMFGQVEATNVAFTDSTRLDVLAPAQTAGVVSVSVQNRLEGVDDEGNPRWSLPSNVRNFTYIEPQGPAPTLTEVSPATGSVDGGVQVTLTGTDFLLGAQVTFDGKASGNVVFAGPTSLTATLPSRTAPGVVDVEVVNPDGQSSRLTEAFEYFIPAPTVTGVFPPEASTAGGTFIVVNGTGFRAGVQALFVPASGDPLLSPNVNRVSGGTMLVATPSVQTGGDYTLRAVNVDGQSADWSGTFRFLEPAGPAPVIEGIDPGTGFNDTANAVTLTGSDFRGAPLPSVLVGNESASVDSFIDCPSDPSCAAGSETDTVVFLSPVTTTEGPVVVRLINDDGQSDTSVFTYVKRLGQPPQIFEVNPPQGKGGDTITLTGFNFTVDETSGDLLSSLLVRGSQLSQNQIVSASETQISFTMPTVQTTIALNVEITIRNPDEQRSSANFLYVPDSGPAPFISQVSPGDGPIGTPVTISGAYLDSIDQVFFGPVSVSSSNYTLTSTQVTMDVPSGAPLGTSVIRLVDTDEGRTASASFTVTEADPAPPPSLYSITPAEVPPAGGTTVTLTGANFDASATVTVAGAAVSSPTITATQITFSAPANPEGTVTVTVRNPDGQSASVPFRYKTPTVVSGEPEAGFLSPDRVHASIAGDEVTVVGQNLAGATAASVEGGGSYAASIVGTPSETSVRVRLDAGLPPTNDAGGVPYRVQLSFPSGAITSPTFAAMAPRAVSWSLEEDGSLFLFGEWFNPPYLTGLNLDDGAAAVPFVISGASEGLVFADAAGSLFPGADYELRLIYDTLGQPVSPFDSGQPPPVLSGPSLHAEIFGTLVEGSDPSGVTIGGFVERLAELSNDLGAPAGQTFVLEDAGGAVIASGTWAQGGGDAGGEGTPAEGDDGVTVTFTSTTALAEGDYRVVLGTERGSRFAVTDLGAVQVSPRGVADVQPQPAQRGDAVGVNGVFGPGDYIVAAPDGAPTATVQLGTVPAGYSASSGADGGQTGQFGVTVSTGALAEGTWRVCAQAPGALVDCGTENSATLDVQASQCGDAVTGLGVGGVVTVSLDKDISGAGVDCGGGPGAVLQVRPSLGGETVWVRYLDVQASGTLQVVPGEDLCEGGMQYDQCGEPIDLLGQDSYANRLHLVLQDVGGDGTGTVTVQIGLGYGPDDCSTPDQDGDGVQPCKDDCRDDNDQVLPGATEVCDGLDNDCDGTADVLGPCIIQGADGVCAEGRDVCQPGGGTVCEAARGPSSFEICGNTDDDDCDALVDEGDCEPPGVLATPYDPDTLAGLTEVPAYGDDYRDGPHPIGFEFPYWGQRVSWFWLSTNGVLSFQDEGDLCCGGELPGRSGGIVAFAWSDLRSNRVALTGYEVLGTAPNRRLVIDVTGFDYQFGGPGYEREAVSAQIKLFEGTGEIEVHYPRLWGSPDRQLTQGFGDFTGLRALVAHPSRVNQSFGGDGTAVLFLPHQLKPVCGDLVCDANAGEDPMTCPADCDTAGEFPTPTCGDGVCEADPFGESELFGCVQDCGGGRCGNGVCEGGEDAGTCAADCGANLCGNGTCDAGEELYCYQDCGGADYDDDGDGLVTSAETTTSSTNPDSDGDLLLDGLEVSYGTDPTVADTDTGTEPDGAEVLNGRSPSATPGDDLPSCGDGFCEDGVEDPSTCLADCWCGNFNCESTEDSATCPADCGGGGTDPGPEPGGECGGDGVCDPGEDPFRCPDDCQPGGCNFDGMCEAWEDQVQCDDCTGGAASCGDYATDGGEECDDGPTGSSQCDIDCTFPECGDGIWNPYAAEGCDDGGATDGDGCSATCTVETGFVCWVDPYDDLQGMTICQVGTGDDDADGFTNDSDNCPTEPNMTQDDGDADGVGDICDLCPAVMGPAPFGCPEGGM